jgi:hypothetical protein
MNPAIQPPLELAKLLLAAEFDGDGAKALQGVYARIHAQLAPVVGARGVGALLDRSIKLAAREHGELRKLDLPGAADTRNTEALEQLLRELEPPTAVMLATSVLASLLALIMRFIGEGLLMQLLQRAFPQKVMPETTSHER